MMLTAILLAATIWTLPSGSAHKPSVDRLPAPVIQMRWNVPSGGRAAPMADPKGAKTVAPVCQQAAPRSASADGALFQGNKDATLMAGTRKLSEEPNADAIAAVLYTEGQCSKPIVIGKNIGINLKAK